MNFRGKGFILAGKLLELIGVDMNDDIYFIRSPPGDLIVFFKKRLFLVWTINTDLPLFILGGRVGNLDFKYEMVAGKELPAVVFVI